MRKKQTIYSVLWPIEINSFEEMERQRFMTPWESLQQFLRQRMDFDSQEERDQFLKDIKESKNRK